MWAGICALINDARQTAGLPALAFLNPLLYPLLGSAGFRDIQAGSNGAFTAAQGYDRVTGIGTPDIKQLIAMLTTAQPQAVAAQRSAKRTAARVGA